MTHRHDDKLTVGFTTIPVTLTTIRSFYTEIFSSSLYFPQISQESNENGGFNRS